MPNSISADFEDFRREYAIGTLEEMETFPKFVQIETISGCNARCRMCSVHDWTRSKSALSQPFFEQLLAELTVHRDWVEQVTLHLGGEPLLDRRLEERVSALKQAGIRSVALTTNASLLTKERARRLLEAGIDMIDFSIDGASAATFEAIRVNLSYEEVRDNVLGFLAARNASGRNVQVRVRMVIQPENANEFDDFVAYWRHHLGPADYVLGRFLNWWAGWRQEIAVRPGSLLREIPPAADFNRLPCLAPFSTLVILSDGRVPLCCLDYNADTEMGNITGSSIADVWRGETFHKVRKAHLANGRVSMDFCRDCHIFASGSGIDLPGVAPAVR